MPRKKPTPKSECHDLPPEMMQDIYELLMDVRAEFGNPINNNHEGLAILEVVVTPNGPLIFHVN